MLDVGKEMDTTNIDNRQTKEEVRAQGLPGFCGCGRERSEPVAMQLPHVWGSFTFLARILI